MSVEFGAGSSGDDRMAEALRNAGHHVFAHLYETYAARLFDYCVGLLDDEVAATIAVQDSLVAVDSKTGSLPDPDQLRVQLYGAARRQCLSKLPRRRPGARPGSEATTLREFIAEQAYPEGATASGDVQAAIAAFARLADRDRDVLNLAFRHGIEGADLALVLGVSPRRARAMVSEAGARFRKSAAVVVVLRGGLTGCDVLEAIAGTRERVPPPLTRERRERLTRHLESCARCTDPGGGRAVGPETLAEVPMATPPLTLRLRLTRTALAVASYRRGSARGNGAPGRYADPARHRAVRGLAHAAVVSSLGLAVLSVPGVLLYRIASGEGAGPVTAQMAAGVQHSPSASPSPRLASSRLEPRGRARRHHRHRPPLPGFGPAPLGVLPAPPRPTGAIFAPPP